MCRRGRGGGLGAPSVIASLVSICGGWERGGKDGGGGVTTRVP